MKKNKDKSLSCTYNNDTPFFNIGHLKYMYLCTDGRLNRKRYWIANLLLALFLYPINLYFELAFKADEFSLITTLTAIGLGIITIFFVVLSVMLSIKRAHDRNWSGHFLWLMLIPIVNFWPMIELYFIRGTKGGNRFGEDPLTTAKKKNK
jgi:uncharacterized membrane protein YhaH (DUF805 family)